MKIATALKKAKKEDNRIGSESLGMLQQTPETLIFWLLEDKESSDDCKKQLLNDILNAKDWQLE
jgi:hypothetical protein